MSTFNAFMNQFIPMLARNEMNLEQARRMSNIYLQDRLRGYEAYDKSQRGRMDYGAELAQEAKLIDSFLKVIEGRAKGEPNAVMAFNSIIQQYGGKGQLFEGQAGKFPPLPEDFPQTQQNLKALMRQGLVSLGAGETMDPEVVAGIEEGYGAERGEGIINKILQAQGVKAQQALTRGGQTIETSRIALGDRQLTEKGLERKRLEAKDKFERKEGSKVNVEFEDMTSMLESLDTKTEAIEGKLKHAMTIGKGGTLTPKQTADKKVKIASLRSQLDAAYDNKIALTEKMIKSKAVDEKKVYKFLDDMDAKGIPIEQLLSVRPEELVEMTARYDYKFNIYEARTLQVIVSAMVRRPQYGKDK